MGPGALWSLQQEGCCEFQAGGEGEGCVWSEGSHLACSRPQVPSQYCMVVCICHPNSEVEVGGS